MDVLEEGAGMDILERGADVNVPEGEADEDMLVREEREGYCSVKPTRMATVLSRSKKRP